MLHVPDYMQGLEVYVVEPNGDVLRGVVAVTAARKKATEITVCVDGFVDSYIYNSQHVFLREADAQRAAATQRSRDDD